MITIDQAIKAYIKIRDEIAAIEKAHKEHVSGLKKNLDKLESFMLQQTQEQNVTSFKTEYGTAFVQKKDSATVADWDALFGFVLENEAYDFLEKRVSKLAVRSHLEANKELPPGVNYSTSVEISVRSPSKTSKE
jgi:hypothetical protein